MVVKLIVIITKQVGAADLEVGALEHPGMQRNTSSMKVKVFFVSYERANCRFWWPESLSSKQAFAIARVLAVEGLKPRVVKAKVAPRRVLDAATYTRNYELKTICETSSC